MTHGEIQELLAGHALNALIPAERSLVDTHLSACDGCRASLEDLRAAAGTLVLAVSDEVPPAAAKKRLMKAVRHTAIPWKPVLAWAAGLLVVVGIAAVWTSHQVPRPVEVMSINGTVLTNDDALSARTRLPFGKMIATGPGGSANVRVDGGAAFHLGPGSEAVVTQTKDGLFVHLSRGSILSAVKTGTPYAVLTPWLQASAVGTVFYVQMDRPEKAGICACRGTIRVWAEGYGEEMTGDPHLSMGLELKNGKAEVAHEGILRHNDAGVKLVEGLVE